ncbi:MAG: patatin-like phospholipase family protein [Chitinophagaceae bacterium]|nr:patatin-like phospholipase family protein [Chitinophagaceae bacterium]
MGQTVNNSQSDDSLTVEEFTSHPEVQQCLQKLHEKYGATNPFIVSDVMDDEGNQYVNLVQKGGGVLGVALVGYTYILEAMGIRFLRLAGTSAGAINTALMTVIRTKKDPKSDEILKAICDLKFFNLVDGHPAAKWVIQKFITHKDFTIKAKKWIISALLVFAILILSDIVMIGLEKKMEFFTVFTRLSFVLTGFYLLLLASGLSYITMLFKRLKNSGYGINPGDFFYDWIKTQMINNGVKTVSDLRTKAALLPNLHLRVPHPMGMDGIKGDVTFITSELVTQNKIQFPEMCNLFRKPDDIDSLQPAGFIRASMSIPVFFESYMINNIPCEDPGIIKLWEDKLGQKEPPSTARFVDGGILSNFPINLFYNPNVLIPRMPSFGIDLDDSKPEDKTMHASSWSLGGYFGRMFDTIRYYYDKDFLLKNKVYEKGIGKINVSEYNWLNFFLTKKDKLDMLLKGAGAATDFLLAFDWHQYKYDRADMQEKINAEKPVASIVKASETITT